MASSALSLPDTPRTASPCALDDHDAAPSPCSSSASHPSSPPASAPLKGKEKARRGPLRLLDLPVDILKEIIHQLPHTNDLTSLALCHSALHRLAIPCIYSRFDIVWPDESTHTEPRVGVDALTYGLATLVMGDDGFPHQNRRRFQSTPPSGTADSCKPAAVPYPIARRRFGNYYAQFTKKFSLGNGPAGWVQEYMIAKEGGKMLGTLVALAVARMINLETFVWDMPTGVLRDVWLALSSLADRSDGEECRLERLWIRWHDNTTDAPTPPPAPPILNNVTVPPPPNTTHPSGLGAVQPPISVPQPLAQNSASAIDRVEHPTFSVVPSLKSLSVLDIDELPYLDEMSILVARSQRKLRELRVGIAVHAQQRDWVTPWEGDGVQQVDYNSEGTAGSAIGEKRLGGILGILVGRVHNLRHSEKPPIPPHATAEAACRANHSTPTKAGTTPSPLVTPVHDREPENGVEHFENALEELEVSEGVSLLHSDDQVSTDPVDGPRSKLELNLPVSQPPIPQEDLQTLEDTMEESEEEPILNGQLKLEVLELERVPLSVPVLLRAFDWTMLTTLTLLHCNHHEQLWKTLRRNYTPRSSYPPGSTSSSKAYKASYTLRTEYSLSLKKIHTNTVSPSLISFLKETLAPNTLEVLFLQEGRTYSSTVTVDAIYRGPLKRHKASLKKLMIDSEKGPDGHTTTNLRSRRWMLNREILTFITSGRMSNLRELAVSIDYKDWHHFLQRLPLIPHIRSLYIPFIAEHAHGNNIDPRELAYQILDIVHLRPEIELCYMGLLNKCFEILENRPSNYDLRQDGGNVADGGTGYVPHDPLMSDEESEATEDEDEDDLDGGIGGADADDSEEDDDEDVHDDSDDESFMQDTQKGPKLRVREILFYEERVEAFRRRHGVLRP